MKFHHEIMLTVIFIFLGKNANICFIIVLSFDLIYNWHYKNSKR